MKTFLKKGAKQNQKYTNITLSSQGTRYHSALEIRFWRGNKSFGRYWYSKKFNFTQLRPRNNIEH